MNFLELPPGPDVPRALHAVIEIPKGSSNKYEYDKELGIFRLDRTLFSPVHYPGDYGFMPQTISEDGDPLDMVVMATEPTFPGCLIEVRPIGVLVMRDDMGLDHKILCAPAKDPRQRDIHGLQHLQLHILREIDYFFHIYKELEGKKSDTYGWEDRVVAYEVIEQSVKRYQDYKAGYLDIHGHPVPGKEPVSTAVDPNSHHEAYDGNGGGHSITSLTGSYSRGYDPADNKSNGNGTGRGSDVPYPHEADLPGSATEATEKTDAAKPRTKKAAPKRRATTAAKAAKVAKKKAAAKK